MPACSVVPSRRSPRTGLRALLEDGSFIPERLLADKFKLHNFREEEINIQHIFLTITKGITS